MNKDSMLQKLASDREAVIDVHTHVGISPRSYIDLGYPYCLSLEDLAIRMKALGISCSVVFPFDSFYYALSRNPAKRVRTTGRISRFPYELENRNLCHEVYEIFPQYSDRFLPFAMFDPARKQAEQVKLLESLAGRYPLYGLKTVTSYSQACVRDLLSRDGRRILDFARELDLPVTIHTSVAPGDPWANVFDILEVVSANPEVRFCLAHTCRFNRKALDAAGRLPNCFVDLSAFHIHCDLAVQNSPSVAAAEERFAADYRRPVQVLKRLAASYPAVLCWGTDTPAYYYINRWTDERGAEHRTNLRCAWDTEAKALRRLDARTIRRIACENPMRLVFGGRYAGSKPNVEEEK